MMLWAVFRNGSAEVVQDDISDEMVKKYHQTGDTAFLIIAKSVINVFKDENLAHVAKAALQQEHPNEKFGVVELHPIVSSTEWS